MVRSPAECTLLVVDDEEANLELIREFLEPEGFGRVELERDPRRALDRFHDLRPDLVLLDLHMPHLGGFEILDELGKVVEADDFVPVLVLTADVSPRARARALSGGAHDFLTKPLDALEVRLRVRNLVRTRLLHQEQRRARGQAEEEASRATLLAEASRVLGTSLDTGTTLGQLARLMVPRWTDACAVLTSDGGVWEAGAATAPDDPGDDATGDRHRLTVPLETGGRQRGELRLRRNPDRPPFTAGDRELALEVAHRAALALENARHLAEAHHATAARDQLLSAVAHDLRNPLSAIIMDAEMLRNLLPAEAHPAEQRVLGHIERVGARMHHLIGDLLEVSRAERGAFSVEPDEVQPLELMDEARELLEPMAASRGVSLIFEGPATSPPLHADSARLLQVLSNLVGNALDFTPSPGPVQVRWSDTPGSWRVTVSDTGPGIAPEDLPHVFRPYWQGSGRPHGGRRGLGLGLVIARAIVEGHGGRIWVESDAGAGTTVHLAIPRSGDRSPGKSP